MDPKERFVSCNMHSKRTSPRTNGHVQKALEKYIANVKLFCPVTPPRSLRPLLRFETIEIFQLLEISVPRVVGRSFPEALSGALAQLSFSRTVLSMYSKGNDAPRRMSTQTFESFLPVFPQKNVFPLAFLKDLFNLFKQ